MIAEERRERLRQWIDSQGGARAADLAERLGVSEDTVRRDIQALAGAGLLRRVRGGALPMGTVVADFAEREKHQPSVKARLARAVVSLLGEGEVFALDGGTSIEAVARAIPPNFTGTVITHSLPVALALQSHTGVHVRMPGGQIHRSSRVLVGSDTVDALREVFPTVAVLGVCNVSLERGLTTPEADEVPLKRVLLANAQMTIAVVTKEKFGTTSQFFVSGLDQVDHVVTDASDPSLVAELESHGVTVTVVPDDGTLA